VKTIAEVPDRVTLLRMIGEIMAIRIPPGAELPGDGWTAVRNAADRLFDEIAELEAGRSDGDRVVTRVEELHSLWLDAWARAQAGG